MDNIAIKLELLPGAHIEDVFREALILAKLINTPVQFTFNEKWKWVRPTDTLDKLMLRWNDDLS